MSTAPLPEARSLPNPPTDGISSLLYLKNRPSMLASSSWDGCVRLHSTEGACESKLSKFLEAGPLLSLAVPPEGDFIVAGGLDGTVRKVDVKTSNSSIVGRHNGTPNIMACSCLHAMDINLMASAGWDSKMHLWDTRTAVAGATISLPGKAYSMDLDRDRNRLVVATSNRRVCFIDVRMDGTQQAEIVLDRESSLKYQTRTVRFFQDGTGIALGSIEGRVAVEYLDALGLSPASDKKKYAFKCHRVKDNVYPVHSIAFHPKFDMTFATGGGDGTVIVWDGNHKKKLTALPKFATSISALAFNHNGTELAIASSYAFEEGEREHPRDEILVRPMLESECRKVGKA